MKIANVLFTYNRPKHTKAVLEALSRNKVLPQKLFIFQDGVKESTNLEDWIAVGEIISSVSWCETEIIIHQNNKGLADSVIDGVNDILQSYDAVIVLEDDCVPHPKFMSYMTEALRKYESNKQVYSITGYAYPVNLKKGETDAYFGGRESSWGWGTWKDRWSQYARDYTLLRKIKSEPQMNERLQTWGADLENYFIGNVYGKCNSWAVFWSLKIIEKGGYSLVPYESLINNIGFDGTGVHCGKGRFEATCCPIDDMRDYILPDNVEITEECVKAYKKYFTSRTPAPRIDVLRCYYEILAKWVAMEQKNRNIADELLEKGISTVAIWGKGKICDLLLNELNGKIAVRYIIESRPLINEYKGIEVTSVDKIESEIQLIIVIPVYDMEKITEKIREAGVTAEVVGIDELVQ